MAHITRRKRPLSRSTLSHGVGLGTALLTGLMTSTLQADDTGTSQADSFTLDEISVEAQRDGGYQPGALSSTKFTQPVPETPRTVPVIPTHLLSDHSPTTRP